MGASHHRKLAEGVARSDRPGERSINVFFDDELFEELKDYAKLHKIAVGKAVSELATIGLECLKDENVKAQILRVRENARAIAISTAFDFTQDCYACGKHGTLTRTHGHIQCRACGANVEPCCDD